MKKITVAVVDDHKLIREMYMDLFLHNSSGDIVMVGAAKTVNETIQMSKVKKPDILLLDINLAHGSGMTALPLVRRSSPSTRIIGLSMYNKLSYAKQMLEMGARGYRLRIQRRLKY